MMRSNCAGALGAFFGFVNGELLRYLRGLRDRPNASPRRKIISDIPSGVDRVRIDTERNFLDVLDKVNEITNAAVDPTHVFTLSRVYEGLLLKMGEKGNDGGSSSLLARSSGPWSGPSTPGPEGRSGRKDA